MRKLIAVGDLHGDYYRLIRILRDEQVLDPVSLDWSTEFENADIILLGDYVDWRGEPLEGPREEWPQGPCRLVEFILSLWEQARQLIGKKNSKGRFYPLYGNHDAMMLEGRQILLKFSDQEPGLLERFTTIQEVLQHLTSAPLNFEQENDLLRLLNWVQQGGDKTMQSFGGLQGWLGAMEGKTGNFLRNLPLAVVVNEKLFSHSLPDHREFWIPLTDHQTKSKDEYEKLREQYIWGRKVWGYDAFAGGETSPFTEEEIDEMLSKLQVKGAVIGHTSLHQKGPYFHLGGKIINIDTHGIPGSQAFVEMYEPSSSPKKRRLKRKKQKSHSERK